ncbi:hypothetical protein AAT19DRAFT_11073 [Rhodotorula toruloides]|uniref:Uncharacterized protein n=1 Tax=Rhodotorula toruloides TaxID=5286 RepID=A0A2S9ZX43_RHOTO|nr:hypothetical protein AAT19DRAFT_11073 [Rhodotorula toruloides]
MGKWGAGATGDPGRSRTQGESAGGSRVQAQASSSLVELLGACEEKHPQGKSECAGSRQQMRERGWTKRGMLGDSRTRCRLSGLRQGASVAADRTLDQSWGDQNNPRVTANRFVPNESSCVAHSAAGLRRSSTRSVYHLDVARNAFLAYSPTSGTLITPKRPSRFLHPSRRFRGPRQSLSGVVKRC